MKHYFRLLIFIFFPFCVSAQDSTKTKSHGELSGKTALVLPIFAALNPDFKGSINSSFKVSYLLNAQYKTTRDWLWEIEFQPYSFAYSGPERIIRTTSF